MQASWYTACIKPKGVCYAILLKSVNLITLVQEFHLSDTISNMSACWSLLGLQQRLWLISILYFEYRMEEMILNVWFLPWGLQWAWRLPAHTWCTENTVIQFSFAIHYLFCSSRKKKCDFFLGLCEIVVFYWTVSPGALSWKLMLVSPLLPIWAPFDFKETDTASVMWISAP